MNKMDVQSWKADIPEFREKTEAFYAGEMSKGDYVATSFINFFNKYKKYKSKANNLWKAKDFNI